MKDLFINRKYIIMALIVLASLMLIIRLFIIQVVKDTYRLSADNNVLRYVTQYPARGLIYDRNGKLIVSNQAAYDIMVIPAQTDRMIDTAGFCSLLNITNDVFNRQMKASINYSRRAPSVFLKQVSNETYARFQEKMFLYPGFYVQPRTLRKYTRPVAAHILGYVSEVDESIIRKNPYYKPGDYIGKSGIEEAYENDLRGQKGVRIFMVDVFSRIKGSYADGEMDTVAVQGSDIISSIDLDLQEYGELLMRNKRGSIVAIEPETGEVLALVSAPNYDPGLLVGRVRSENFARLQSDTAILPLFNRALMASYPPGSTFKPVNGLIGLQEGVISADTKFGCNYGYLFVGCHGHASPLDLINAVANSCNSYFCQTYRRVLENNKYSNVTEAFSKWKEYLDQFGFGARLGTDFVNELTGFIPSPSYYDRYHGKNRWKALSIISIAIGQGEILVTPLQLANQTATIANRGYYYIPHIIKGFGSDKILHPKFSKKHYTTVESKYFDVVVDGMHRVIEAGTGRGAKFDSVQMAGKTGTAQNPHGEDHSIFVLFAPLDNPKIAISVIIENGGFGATWAAPIASLMVEKYLNDTIKRPDLEKRMLEGVINYKAPKKKK
ncbi:MAG TPA: penicillin-binding protein 2 [Bacteroidales bacterium]|nr:penicillin-binding protein 2 [Bacteroidales bacterium]